VGVRRPEDVIFEVSELLAGLQDVVATKDGDAARIGAA
jgi:hypothetical protein